MHHIYTRKRFFLLVGPMTLFYVAFLFIPILIAFFLSLTSYRGLGTPQFNNFENYARMIQDKFVWISIFNTLKSTITVLVLAIPISFFIALYVNKPYRRNQVYKAIIFSPYIIPGVICGLLWLFIFDPSFGLLNNFFGLIGLDFLRLEWIGGRYLTPYSAGIIDVWRFTGFNVAVWSMGMKGLPGDVLEASLIDGANNRQRIIYVTLPLLKDTLVTLVILTITGTFKIFDTVHQLTGGGPNHVSETIVSYMYQLSFLSRLYGYGMSIATFEFFIAITLTLLVMFFTRRRIDE